MRYFPADAMAVSWRTGGPPSCAADRQETDLISELTRPAAELTADVVVVGSGPAGLTLAMELERRGLRSLVLESGHDFGQMSWPLTVNDVRMAPYNMGPSYLGLHAQRALGGGAHVWGGWCAPLRDENLQRPDLATYGGWPLSRAELLPAYARALDVLQVAGDATQILSPPVPLHRAPAIAVCGFGLSPPVRPSHWLKRLQASSRVDIRTRATVEDILTEAHAVSGLRGRTADGTPFVARGARYVIAGGAVLNAILLQRNLSALRLDASRAGAVGQHLMDHPYIYGRSRVTLRPEIEDEIEGSNAWFGGYLSLTPSATELASIGTRDFHILLSRVDARQWSPIERAAAANHAAVFGRNPVLYSTILGMEPIPSDASAVTSRVDDKQVAGDVHLRIAPTQSDMDETAARWLRRHAAAAWRDTRSTADVVAVGHLMGTTRMETSGAVGVVDRDCRVIGVRNLFMAGSSVFPTSGFVNPTLTIVALAVRLAGHIAESHREP